MFDVSRGGDFQYRRCFDATLTVLLAKPGQPYLANNQSGMTFLRIVIPLYLFV
jgi:hypothetical protein